MLEWQTVWRETHQSSRLTLWGTPLPPATDTASYAPGGCLVMDKAVGLEEQGPPVFPGTHHWATGIFTPLTVQLTQDLGTQPIQYLCMYSTKIPIVDELSRSQIVEESPGYMTRAAPIQHGGCSRSCFRTLTTWSPHLGTRPKRGVRRPWGSPSPARCSFQYRVQVQYLTLSRHEAPGGLERIRHWVATCQPQEKNI